MTSRNSLLSKARHLKWKPSSERSDRKSIDNPSSRTRVAILERNSIFSMTSNSTHSIGSKTPFFKNSTPCTPSTGSCISQSSFSNIAFSSRIILHSNQSVSRTFHSRNNEREIDSEIGNREGKTMDTLSIENENPSYEKDVDKMESEATENIILERINIQFSPENENFGIVSSKEENDLKDEMTEQRLDNDEVIFDDLQEIEEDKDFSQNELKSTLLQNDRYLKDQESRSFSKGRKILDDILKSGVNENLLKSYTVPKFLKDSKQATNSEKNHVSQILDYFVTLSNDPSLQNNLSKKNLEFIDSETFNNIFNLKSQSSYIDSNQERISLLRILDNILMAGHKHKISYFSNLDAIQKRHVIHLLFRIAEIRQYDSVIINMFEMIYSLKNDPHFQLKGEVRNLKLTYYIFEKCFAALGRRKNVSRVQWLFNVFEQTDFRNLDASSPTNPILSFTGVSEDAVSSIITAFSRCGLFEKAEDKYAFYEGNKLIASSKCFKAIMRSYSAHINDLQRKISSLEANIIMNSPDAFSADHLVGIQVSNHEEQAKRQSLINDIRDIYIRAFDIFIEYKKRSSRIESDDYTLLLKLFSTGNEFSEKFITIFLEGLEESKQSGNQMVFPQEEHYILLLNFILNHEESLLLFFSNFKGTEENSSEIDFIFDLLVKQKESNQEPNSVNSVNSVSHLAWNLLTHMKSHLLEDMSPGLFAALTNILCEHGDHRALSFVREGEEHFGAFQTPSICLSIVSLFETFVAQKKMTEDDLQFAVNNSINIITSIHSSSQKLSILNSFHELYSGLTIIDSSQEFLPEPVYQFCVQKILHDSTFTETEKIAILNKLLKIYIRDGIELKIAQIIDMFKEINLLPNETTFKIFMKEFQKNPSKWMTYRRKIRNMFPSSQVYSCTAYIWTCLDAEKARKTLDYMIEKNMHVSPSLIDYIVHLLAHIRDERAFDYVNKRITRTTSNFYLLSFMKAANSIFKNFYPTKVLDSVDEDLVKKLRVVYDYMVANGGVSLKLTQAMMNLYQNSAERHRIMNLVKFKKTVQFNKKFRPLNLKHYSPKKDILSSDSIHEGKSEEELLKSDIVKNEIIRQLSNPILEHMDTFDDIDFSIEASQESSEYSENPESTEDSKNGIEFSEEDIKRAFDIFKPTSQLDSSDDSFEQSIKKDHI